MDKTSEISVAGAIGEPAKKRQPTRGAPSTTASLFLMVIELAPQLKYYHGNSNKILYLRGPIYGSKRKMPLTDAFGQINFLTVCWQHAQIVKIQPMRS